MPKAYIHIPQLPSETLISLNAIFCARKLLPLYYFANRTFDCVMCCVEVVTSKISCHLIFITTILLLILLSNSKSVTQSRSSDRLLIDCVHVICVTDFKLILLLSFCLYFYVILLPPCVTQVASEISFEF